MSERPTTEAGRRLIGSILLALQQEGADVADLSWVDEVAAVEAEASALPAEPTAPPVLDEDRLAKAFQHPDVTFWIGSAWGVQDDPDDEAETQTDRLDLAAAIAAEYVRLAADTDPQEPSR